MDILTHNKFNSELSLFFLASNKHACRKALPIVSSKVPKNELVNYFGVKFSSFKFFHQHNEITLQNSVLPIAEHECIDIVLTSSEFNLKLELSTSYSAFMTLTSCFSENCNDLAGYFAFGISYEVKSEYLQELCCPYCKEKLLPYGHHIKIIKSIAVESDVIFDKGEEFKKYPVSLPRMMCSNNLCSEKETRYKERHQTYLQNDLEAALNITHVLFLDEYVPFFTFDSEIANRMVELANGEKVVSATDECIKAIYPCNDYNPVLQFYEQITKLIDNIYYRAKYAARRVYNLRHRHYEVLDSVLTTSKFAKQKIKKLSHRLKILLNQYLITLTTYSQLRPRPPPPKITPVKA